MIYKKKIDFKCLVSLISFLIVLLPHLIWLTENNYITITYGLDRTGTGDQNFLDHIIHPLIFLGKQIGILIPFFLMFLFLNNKLKIKFNFKDNKLLFLLSINIVPIASVFLTSMIMGVKIRTMWMTPFYLFFGVLLIYIFQSQINLNKLKGFTATFLILFIFLLLLMHMFQLQKQIKEQIILEKKLQQKFKRMDNEKSSEINYVKGDEWDGGNLSYHFKSR